MDEFQKSVFRTAQIGAAITSLQEHGIDPAPLSPAMAGDVAAIDRLSRDLLARASDYRAARVRRERSRASKYKRGAAAEESSDDSMGLVRGEGRLPPSVVGFLITLMIEACSRADVAPPAALAQLVRVHLGADTFAAPEFKVPDAFDKAARYKLAYPDASQDEIARHAGVTRPRVSQWGHLDEAVERLRQIPGLPELIRSTTPRA